VAAFVTGPSSLREAIDYRAVDSALELKQKRSGITSEKFSQSVDGKPPILNKGPVLRVNISGSKGDTTFCVYLNVRCLVFSPAPNSPGATADLVLWEDGCVMTGTLSDINSQIQENLKPRLTSFCNDLLKANPK
jgi:hypothetical protein